MSYRILLVDGDIASRYRLRLALRAQGHDVETRAGAGPALHDLLDPANNALPDLLLLGDRLPGMGVIEVLERLRANVATRALPVVLCTGRDDPALTAILNRYCGVAVLRKDRLPTALAAALREACAASPAAGPAVDPTAHQGAKAPGVATSMAAPAGRPALPRHDSLPSRRGLWLLLAALGLTLAGVGIGLLL